MRCRFTSPTALALAALAAAFTGCGDNTEPAITPRALPATAHGRSQLRWKRFRVVQHDLARALVLTPDEVCVESSGQPCATAGPVTLRDWLRNEGIEEDALEQECRRRQGSSRCQDGAYIPFDNPRGVHVVALGGNNPLLRGVFEGIKEPIVTTPLTLERYVLAACGARVAKDRAGAPVVFRRIPLDGDVVSRTPGVDDTVVDLYKALLGRVPLPDETRAITSLVETGALRGDVFARLACFAIATTTEFTYQ